MSPSTRIVLNTLAAYGQSLFALFLSLFSARWLLQALGQSDFGLYGVVGSIVLLITFLNGGLSVGVARFYAYSIGQGHNLPEAEAIDDLKHWFNTALSIHVVLPALLVLIGWPIGEYAIRHWLTIPPDRIASCVWVFRISMLTACVSVFSVPFTAMYAAHQHITDLAIFGVLGTCGAFAATWFLLREKSDRMIVFSLYVMAINVGLLIIQIFRAVIKFKACRVRISYMYHWGYLKRLFGFVGWKMFGMSCVVLRGQGIPILVNLQFGPLINAAYSVADRVSTQGASLAAALQGAFQPALVASEGKGDRQVMLGLALQVCKFGTLLILLFAIPLVLEMKTVLHLWLEAPPEYAGELCQWMLAMLVIDKMTSGVMLAVNAVGRIAIYELVQGSTLFLALPLAWLFFKLGHGPTSLGYALFITMLLYCSNRLLFGKYLLQFPIATWLQHVALPLLLLVAASATAGWGAKVLSATGVLSVCLTTLVTAMVTTGIAWFWMLNAAEQLFVREVVRKMSAWFVRSVRPMAKEVHCI